jgi:hypothetical protein
MLSRTLASLAAAASVLVLASAADAATVWSFNGNSAVDGPVNAQAAIALSGNTMTLDLTNFLVNATSDGQELSGIQLFFNTLPSTAALTSASGTEINIIAGKGKGANTTTGDDNVIGHWGTALSGGSLFLATAGPGAAGGQPFDLILGPGPYTNANNSIIGKDPHIDQLGHFVLDLTGLTGTSYLTGVKLGFGTEGGDYHTATCSGDCGPPTTPPPPGVPEPASWLMMILGVAGVGAAMRQRGPVVA